MYIKGMNEMQWTRQGVVFACDREKRLLNLHKHDVDFLRASSAFSDPFALSDFDARHSVGEERYALIGKTESETLLFVVYTLRGETVRLISARKADAKEAKIYAEQ